MAAPEVSVIVPARDAAAHLDAALDSLTAQTFSSWECTIVENGSSDETAAIAEVRAARDERFRVLRSAAAGVSAARNEGLARASAPWVLFLDADDLLEPDALGTLHARLCEDETLDVAYCGWSRIAPDGDRTLEHPRLRGTDLFAEFAWRCVFAMHAGLARRELMVEAGGFDEHLRTCEDWDLWLRVARMGGRFGNVDGHLALYRMRAESASNDAEQVLADAITVIERAHRPDPRVTSPVPEHSHGADPEGLAPAVVNFWVWAAALALGAGRDPTGLAARVAAYRTFLVDPNRLAHALFIGTLSPRERGPSAWAQGLRAELDAGLRALLAQVEAHTGAPRLAARVLRRLDRLAVEAAPPGLEARAGSIERVEVDAEAPISDVRLQPGADRLLAVVQAREEPIGAVEVAVRDGVVSGELLADAIADRLGWQLVAAFQARTGGRWASGEAAWEVFLQETFGRPDLPVGAFYNPTTDLGAEATRAVARLGVGTLAGGSVSAICDTLGSRLAVAVARAALLGRPWQAPLSEMLRTAPARPAGVIVAPALATPAPAPAAAGARRHDFEALFAHGADPWGYTSDYETRKYAHTLELLPHAPIAAALEVGCAEGHFTVELARRADHVVALDISAIALRRAAERCAAAGLANVEFVRHDIVADPLPGGFDVVVCSELLYYTRDLRTLRSVASKLEGAVRRAGALVHAHAHLVVDDPGQPGFDWELPFGARVIGETLAAARGLRLEEELRTPYYRVQRLRRTRGGIPRRSRRALRRSAQAADPPPDVRRHFLPHGGRPAAAGRAASVERVPILMYHRVAPDCPEPARPWCVHPVAFAEQLDYLREVGYQPISLDDWRHHALGHRPLAGRSVVITFDDGYRDFAEHAWPALEQRRLPALVFLPTGHVGATNAWDAGMGMDAELLGWDEIRALEGRGVRFGSHTASHSPLTGISVQEAEAELTASRTRLREELRVPLDAIAYPYGDVDPAVEHLAGACGYAFGLTCRAAGATFDDHPLHLPRIEVAGTDSHDAFITKLG